MPLSSSYAAVTNSAVATTPADNLPPRVFHFPALISKPNVLSLDHGIAFTAIRNANNDDVLRAIVCATVPAHRIHSISRVRGQFHVYFKDPSFANLLITKGLPFGTETLDVFPVGRLPRRVVISNVAPYVPDADLLYILKKFGKVRGAIVPLRASTTDPDFSEVQCHRRSVFVDFEDDAAFLRLPESVEVFYGDVSHEFLFNEPIKCFTCGKPGHNKSHCPDANNPTVEEDDDTEMDSTSTTTETNPVTTDPTNPRKRLAEVNNENSKRKTNDIIQSSSGNFTVDLIKNTWTDKLGTFSAFFGYDDIKVTLLDAGPDKTKILQAIKSHNLDTPSLTTLFRQLFIFIQVHPDFGTGAERSTKLSAFRAALKSAAVSLKVNLS